MRKLTGTDLSRGATPLGVLSFRGPDAAKFLQGQLSADVEKLEPGSSTLAGLHNAQGRVIALLGLVRTSPDDFLAVVTAELATTVIRLLTKFVFRAKVRIEDASTAYVVLGLDSPVAGLAQVRSGNRVQVLAPLDAPDLVIEDRGDAGRSDWERAEVREGLPQIVAATSESFVAQMLNLDLVSAIAFDKGCYTGQEVIARAHYRGRVKRRLQRWRHDGAAPLAPGDSARTENGRALSVVRVGPRDPVGQEVLAVGNFGADAGEPAGFASPGVVLEGPLPLPYTFPD